MGEKLKIVEFAPGTVSKEAKKAIRKRLNDPNTRPLTNFTQREYAAYTSPGDGQEHLVWAMTADGGRTAIIWVNHLNG